MGASPNMRSILPLCSSPPEKNHHDNCNQSDAGAHLCEQFPVLRVKGQLMLSWNADLASEHAFGERAAACILQRLHDPTEPIYKTSHARVRRANHRTARLDAPKNRVQQMLLRTRRMQKPAVVRNVDE